jgi:precorrin-6B methylase 2
MKTRIVARTTSLIIAAAVAGFVAVSADAPRTQSQTGTQKPIPRPDVIWVPTQDEVVTAMLKMANVSRNDVVYDLGCGDGKIVIAAAKQFGARGVGIDIDPQRIREANSNVKSAGVADRVTILEGNIFDPAISIRDATVVTLYLLQSLNEKLRPRLQKELRPGTRVVSNAFHMGTAWPAERTQVVGSTTIYLWTIK